MFQSRTHASRGYGRTPASSSAVVRNLDEPLSQATMPALRNLPAGAYNVKPFVDMYREEVSGTLTIKSADQGPYPRTMSVEQAWASAEAENRRVAEALRRAEPPISQDDFFRKIYTPKALFLPDAFSTASDAITAAAMAIINQNPSVSPGSQPAVIPTNQPGQPPTSEPGVIPGTQAPSGSDAVSYTTLDQAFSAGVGVSGYLINDRFAVGPIVVFKPYTRTGSVTVLSAAVGPILVNGQGLAPYYFASPREIGNRQIVGWNSGSGTLNVVSVPIAGALPIRTVIDVTVIYDNEVFSTTFVPFIPIVAPPTLPTGGTQPSGGTPTGTGIVPTGGSPGASTPTGTGIVPTGGTAGTGIVPAGGTPASGPGTQGLDQPASASGLGTDELSKFLASGVGVHVFMFNNQNVIGPIVLYTTPTEPASIVMLTKPIGPFNISGQGTANYYMSSKFDFGSRVLVPWIPPPTIPEPFPFVTLPLPGTEPLLFPLYVSVVTDYSILRTTLTPPTVSALQPAKITATVDELNTILSSGVGLSVYFINDRNAVGPITLYKGPTVPAIINRIANPIGPVIISGQGATPYYIGETGEIQNRQIVPWLPPPTSTALTTYPIPGAQPILAPAEVTALVGMTPYPITISPPQSTALVTTSKALVITPSRRSAIAPLTDDEIYTTFFFERYNPPPPVADTSAVVPAAIVLDAVTIQAINDILFDGMNPLLAKSIWLKTGEMGLYPALKSTKFIGSELYALVLHDLEFVLGWDDESIAAIGQSYAATFAYEALREAVLGPDSPLGRYPAITSANSAKNVRDTIIALGARLETGANSYLQSAMYAIGVATSDEFGITAWTTLPYTPRDEMGIITNPGKYVGMGPGYGGMNTAANDRAYYQKLLLWYFNKGILGTLRKGTSLATYGLSPYLTAKRLDAFTDYTASLAKMFFKSNFKDKLVATLYPMMQRGGFMNWFAGSALMASLGGIGAMFAVFYGGWGWPAAGAALVQFAYEMFMAFRSRGRVSAADLRTDAMVAKIKALEAGVIQDIADATDLPIRKEIVVAMLTEVFNRFAQYIEQTTTIIQSLAKNDIQIAGILYRLGLNSYKLSTDRAAITKAFKELLSLIGVPENDVLNVMLDMTTGGGNFGFYRGDDTVSDVLYNALVGNLDTIKKTLAQYLVYKGKQSNLSSLSVAQEALRQFTQKFGENLKNKPGSVFLRMPIEIRAKWYVLFGAMFGLNNDQVLKVLSEQTFDDETPIEPESVTNVDAFRNAIEPFYNPENSLRKITISSMPPNYKWFAVKRRRAIFKTAWGNIFRAMGAPPDDVSSIIESLDPYKPGMSKYDSENRSGIRINGAHGSRPGFNDFLERNMAVFSKFMAAFTSDERVRFTKVFFMRFFGLRGFRPLVDKVFSLTPAEYVKASPARVEQIDVLEMDAGHLDGDKPDIPEPTDADLQGYGVPWPGLTRGSVPLP